MILLDIACLVFVSVTANHLGLVKSAEEVLRKELLVVNCPRCLSFWLVLAYGLKSIGLDAFITVLAISFLASYAAIWLELFEGYIDTLYKKYYDKVLSAED